MSESNSKVLKLKLLVDKNGQKVLFAEASKEFVDFLFSLLSLPLGKVVKLLTMNRMVGCIANLYHSIESLNQTYVNRPKNVQSVLNPKLAPMLSVQSPALLLSNSEFMRNEAYMCLYQESSNNNPYSGNNNPRIIYHLHVADNPNTPCPSCNRIMSCKLQFVDSDSNSEDQEEASASGGGFVKGVVTYMVMDNLEVKPMSTISSIALINSFNIVDLSSLEEKVVDVGVDEGLNLLQVSLQSKNVLTSVFLGNLQAGI